MKEVPSREKQKDLPLPAQMEDGKQKRWRGEVKENISNRRTFVLSIQNSSVETARQSGLRAFGCSHVCSGRVKMAVRPDQVVF